MESEAVLSVLSWVESGRAELWSSEPIDLENSRNTDVDRQAKVEALLRLSSRTVILTKKEIDRARKLSLWGFGAYDALHIASAESAKSDYLLTTDDDLTARARRSRRFLAVRVSNPLDWVKENCL